MSKYELVNKVCSYAPWADERLLDLAYAYALEKHDTQKRESGEPYFSHPLEVASLLARMRMDPQTIAAGLLHDVLEDSNADYQELVKLFGQDIADIVEGVSKLSSVYTDTREKKQVSNLKKLLLASSVDIRVLIVKLADRLHNIRTLSALTSRARRCRIAQETLEIYAPVAKRMGMHTFGEEMENVAFSHLHPIIFSSLYKEIKRQRIKMRPLLEDVAHTMMDQISHAQLRARIGRRWKTPYSVYQKMIHLYGNETLKKIHIPPDLVGFRVLTNDVPSCYQILGLLHSQWRCVFQGFRDYISLPKKNGYQSLHSRIMIKNVQVEFQIRTHKMNAVAQHGLAAHWRYKTKRRSPQQIEFQETHAWLAKVLDTLEEKESPEVLLESAGRHLFQDRLFCFDDDGKLLTLPRGSTVVDFAYGCGEETGAFCSGALVNGKSLPIWFSLCSGDEVHIQKAKIPQVSPAWEEFAPSGQARSGIQKSLKRYAQERARLLGKMILESAFDLHKNSKTIAIRKQCHLKGYKNLDELYVSVGSGGLSITELDIVKKRQHEKQEKIILKGLLPDFPMRFVPKLFPLPGEKIVGIVTKDLSIDVYPLQSSLIRRVDVEPFQVIPLEWDLPSGKKNQMRFPAEMILLVHHKVGVLKTITTLIAQEGGNIDNIKTTRDDPHFRQLRIGLDVLDFKNLESIVKKLDALNVIHRVRRVRSGTENPERTRRFLYTQS